MRTAIIGAGPAGLVLGAALARRGSEVTLVDRDPGPPAAGTWPRRGVMQFHHAHAIRGQVTTTLRREVPAAFDRLVERGAERITLPLPGGAVAEGGMRCRRSTFEEAVREVVATLPGVTLRHGHVDAIRSDDTSGLPRATGLVVDGEDLDADLVVDASGRAGRVTRALRAPPSAGGICGIAYVDRQYQLHPGAELGPLVNPLAWQANFDGYQCILFVHEQGIFSVLLVRPSDSRDLVDLRHAPAFEAAAHAIPGLSDWTDPERSKPMTEVMPGGTLVNAYRGQRGPDGGLALPGLLFVDAVCTTTPNFGRGLATTMMQVDEVLRLLDEQDDVDAAVSTDGLTEIGERLDAFDEASMRPWVEDHAIMDESIRRRWSGADIDLTGPIPSDLIMEAAKVDSRIAPAIGPYLTMTALPSVLTPVEPLARTVYEGGWRPTPAPGPTRAELAGIVAAAVA